MEYYCTECKKRFKGEPDKYVECPVCGRGTYVRDYGDYEPPMWEYFGDEFNWNKK
jgi:hypothetical protein